MSGAGLEQIGEDADVSTQSCHLSGNCEMVGRQACCGEYRVSCSVLMSETCGEFWEVGFALCASLLTFLFGNIGLLFCRSFPCPAAPCRFQYLATHPIPLVCTMQPCHSLHIFLTHRGNCHVCLSDPRYDCAARCLNLDDMCEIGLVALSSSHVVA